MQIIHPHLELVDHHLAKPEPGDAILFLNTRDTNPENATGCNHIGIILQDDSVVFCRRRRATSLSVSKLRLSTPRMHLLKPKDAAVRNSILRYFNLHRNNPRLLELGFISLSSPTLKVLDSVEIMPNVREPLSAQEHERAWQRVTSRLEPMDFIFTYDTTSFVSRIIAWIDSGSWSHVGVYVGDGQIVEAISSGVIRRSLDVYRTSKIRLGVYRVVSVNEEGKQKAIFWYNQQVGKPYNYAGVIRLAFRKVVDRYLSIRWSIRSPRDLSPNDMIYRGWLYLVDYV